MIDFRSAFFLIVIIESFLFAAQLLGHKSIKYPHHRVLGMLMITLGFYITSSLLRNITSYNIGIYANYFTLPLFLAITPFYFLYVKSLTAPSFKFSNKNFFHFIPSFQILLLNIIFLSVLPEKLQFALISKSFENHENIAEFNTVLKVNMLIEYLSLLIYNIQLVFYVVKMFLTLRKHQHYIKYYFSYEKNVKLNWLKVVVYVIIFNSILDFVIVILSFYTPNIPPLFAYIDYFILFSIITMLGFFGIRQQEIFDKTIAPVLDVDTLDENAPISEFQDLEILENSDEDLEILPMHFMISNEEQLRIANAVIKLIEEEKIYRDNNLSVYELSKILKTNKTYISVSINNILKKNFRQLINEYRIEESKIILLDTAYDHYSMNGIAQLVGFTSKSTFNQAFRKFTNLNPSEYKKEHSLSKKMDISVVL